MSAYEIGAVVTTLLVLLLFVGLYVWYALALSHLFPRLGEEGWKGWVPVLNEATILSLGGVPSWNVVFYFVPFAQFYGVYLRIVAMHRINEQFGRGAGWTVLAALLTPVWATMLARGAAPYPESDRLAGLQPGPRRGLGADDDYLRRGAATGNAVPQVLPYGTSVLPPGAPVPPGGSVAPAGPGSFSALAPAPLTPTPSSGFAASSFANATPPVPPPSAPQRFERSEPEQLIVAVPGIGSPPSSSAPTDTAPASTIVEAPPARTTDVRPSPMPLPPASVVPQTKFAPPPPRVLQPHGVPDADDDFDETVVIARRRGTQRVLVLDDGRRFVLSATSVVIGRNPEGQPGEQQLSIPDRTRTLSKTHARLTVEGDEWRLVDLNSTNGVVVVADDGTETLLDPGEGVVGSGRFILGEVGMQVETESDS